MRAKSRISGVSLVVVALLWSLVVVATSPAQSSISVYRGKFRLADQVVWGDTLLPPGDYTVTVASGSMPTFALVRDSSGRPVGRFVSSIQSGTVSTGNALLLRNKDGQLRVYSLALTSLGRVLVYDSALAQEAIVTAHEPQTVTIMSAKR